VKNVIDMMDIDIEVVEVFADEPDMPGPIFISMSAVLRQDEAVAGLYERGLFHNSGIEGSRLNTTQFAAAQEGVRAVITG